MGAEGPGGACEATEPTAKRRSLSVVPDAQCVQYEIPFKLSISTFHVSVMAITPAIASHKVRHPSWSPSNFPMFMASDFKNRLP